MKIKELGTNKEHFVVSNLSDLPIGKIKWSSKKNEYRFSFYGAMLYHKDCKKEIDDFIEEMKEKKIGILKN